MKLSVRTKIANGLVICLLVPRAGESAINLFETYHEGLNSFSAVDDFDLQAGQTDSIKISLENELNADPASGDPTGGDPTGGDPTGGDPTGGDPTGGDPTGGDPTGGDPTGGPLCEPGTAAPALLVDSPRQLVTAEDGSSAVFAVAMKPDPQIERTFRFVSTRPDEARPKPDAVVFGDDACVPKSIWVVGQNDTLVDGDQDFEIDILDEQDFVVNTLKGVNLDNDDFAGVSVIIRGSTELPEDGLGDYMVRATNISGENLKNGDFEVKLTDGLQVQGFAASTMSGETVKAKLKKGTLTINKVDLKAGDALLISLGVQLTEFGPEEQRITARYIDKKSKEETDNDIRIDAILP